jgi:hypothetical protein
VTYVTRRGGEYPAAAIGQFAQVVTGISQHVCAENTAMAKVPDGATVEATQGMETPLAARTDVFYARDPGNPAPECIAIDATDYYAQPPIGGNIGQWVRRDHPDASYQQIFGQDQFRYR